MVLLWGLQAVGFEPTRISPTDLKTVALTSRPSLLKAGEVNKRNVGQAC
jgi:hypothetical protein